MTRSRTRILAVLLAGLLSCGTGCTSDTASDQSSDIASVETPADLEFLDVVVEGQGHEGWFGAKSAHVDVSGTITNNTDDTIGDDDLPLIVDDSEAVKISGHLEEGKLESGETGTFRYEGDIDVNGDEAPTLAFSGEHTFSGLDEAQRELDSTIEEVFDEFEGQREQKSAEEEREKKRKQKEIDDLKACVGNTAEKALKTAEGTEYEAHFKDDHEVDVTDDVKDNKSDSKAAKASVVDVEVSQGGLLSRPRVTFALDYTDPKAEKERQDKKAREKALSDVKNAKGATVDEALAAAETAGLTAHLEDSEGNEISLDDFKRAPAGHPLHKAKIKDSSSLLSSVTYTADYRLADEQMHATYRDVTVDSTVEGSYDRGYYDISVRVEGNVENDTLVPIFAADLPVFVQSNSDKDNWCWLHYPNDEDVSDYLYPYSTSEFSFAITFNVDWTLKADEIGNYAAHLLTFEDQDGASVEGLDGVETRVNTEIAEILAGIVTDNAAHKEARDRELAEERARAEQQRLQRTCYVTETGYAYHTDPDCHTIRHSTLDKLTVGEAIEQGYEPCAFCS